MPTIRLTITQDDPAAPVDGATLLSLTRADTGAAVPFGSAAFTAAGGGVWTHAFTAPAVGLAYAYTFAFHRADGTTDAPAASTYFDAGTAVTGRYITESEGDDFLSSIGVDVYSDGNGTGSRRRSAVAFAVRAAEARADSRLAGNRQSLTVPLDFGTTAVGDIDANFKVQVLGYYAYFLAAKRPLNGDQAPGVSFKQLRDDADKFFDDVWYGDATIDGAAAGTPVADVPIAVPATVNADGLTVTAANVRGYRYVWDEALGRWRY